MRKLAVAAALASAFATPALARDGSAYVGLDAGVMKPEKFHLRYSNSNTAVGDALELRHKTGFDLDAVVGYDFGLFRLEGEVGYKRAEMKDALISRAALTAAGQSLLNNNFTASGRGSYLSGMINGLIDIGPADGFNGSIGVGIGEARGKYRAGLFPATVFDFTGSDSAMAYQAIGEVRVPISSTIDLGLKYRHFETAKLNFGPFCVTTCVPTYHLRAHFKSDSLLASLRFNLGGVAPPPPPPPPPPSPPPPPPQTQTCADGSVIPATDTCPPPPPPPPPPVQRGERGE